MKKTENGKSRFPKVAGNENVDVYAVRKARYSEGSPVQTLIHPHTTEDSRARFALACMERWAMLMATPDGEDSAGRQKARRMTAQELVVHACDVAEAADDEFKKRGWSFAMPSIDELIDAVKDIEDGND